MHLVFLYGKEKSAAARQFTRGQRKLILDLRRQLGVTAKEANDTYALMQWCDALSLLICKHAIQPEHRMTEISKGPDGVSYELCQMSADVLSVRPWPFITRRFNLTVESRTVKQLSFKSTQSFQDALWKAQVRENIYTMKRI